MVPVQEIIKTIVAKLVILFIDLEFVISAALVCIRVVYTCIHV